ncbi:DUF4062 domain-containing protein [Streptomyces sp. NPDC056716]|uniref:DUF4062 domain-containing protein n=1 Tax=unclassified Streptomyces TaxID=2593676 RepID=UPI0036975806
MRSEVRSVKVYLSSTVADLADCRAAVLAALRRLRLQVIAMEDYAAFDNRPVEKCLADVAGCDLYIGIFGFRYGCVPESDALNPDGRSITELEYRKAGEAGCRRLIFLVKDGAEWPTRHIDALTGPGAHPGHSIKRLRTELMKEHGVGWFGNPHQLAAEVVPAVAAHLHLPLTGDIPSRPVAEPPHPRRLTGDLHLLHAPKDQEAADRLVTALGALWHITTSSTHLLATTPEEMLEADRAVTSARAVAFLRSPALTTILGEHPERSRRILTLVRDRTSAPLLGLTAPGHGDWTPPDPDPFDITHPISGARAAEPPQNQLHELLSRTVLPRRHDQEIGLPVVVVAMTDTEAAGLLGTPSGPVADIVRGLGLPPEAAAIRYGPARTDWRPFGGDGRTVRQILEDAVSGVNDPDLLLRGRKIRLQYYGFDDLLRYDPAHSLLFRDIARNGCLVLADELSLLAPELETAFVASPLYRGAQVSLITVAPDDPAMGTPHELIRRELALRLSHTDRRFGADLDPLCEMNVASRRHLDRWLRGSLPQTLDAHRTARPSAAKARLLEAELGTRPTVSMARLITEGGAT